MTGGWDPDKPSYAMAVGAIIVILIMVMVAVWR